MEHQLEMDRCENLRKMVSGIEIFDEVAVDDLNFGKGDKQ